MKKSVSAICNVLSATILISIIVVAGGIMAFTWLGYKPMAILSGSMSPTYNVGGLIFINTNVAPEDMSVDDVMTYEIDAETFVTHRIISINNEDKTFITKGDANNEQDLSPVPFDRVVGKGWAYLPYMGYAMMNLRTQKGLAVGIILIAVLLVLFIVPVVLEPDEKPTKKRKRRRKRRKTASRKAVNRKSAAKEAAEDGGAGLTGEGS